ncbi:MAG: 30S ribosomal protein S1 [Chitinophagaceae bacterium]|nr:MAG: 30S ribosomal protein S1 [Chitinophagaceae bacterium]
MTEKNLENQNFEQEESNKDKNPASAEEKSPKSDEKQEQAHKEDPVTNDAGEGKKSETEETPTEDKSEEPSKEVAAEESSKEEKVEETVSAEDSTEEKKAETEEPAEVTEEKVAVAHDDYDWDAEDESKLDYTKGEFKKLEDMYTDTLVEINDNEIVKGSIVGVTENDVILNIGFKSDGLVSKSEFRDLDEIKIGTDVDVYVVRKEDERGQLLLSRKNAKLVKAWDTIVESYEKELVVEGKVISKTKGGLIVDVLGMETFLPGSQIDVKPILDYDSFVGKTMEFKVVKINETIKNAVVSHKALIESDIEEQRAQIISTLEKGQVLEGTVKNLTDFGAFIDLGGVDGLLYITDISWGRINHPNEVLELNETINVVVLDFDDEKKRISLGLKQLQDHPWDTLDKELEIGSTVKGKIVNIEDYGAFLEIIPGVEGLVHISEVSWSYQPVNSKEFFKLGDAHEAKVMTIDREERKMSLSIKRLKPDPWENVDTKFPPGSKHTGEVKNITPYGVFIELDEGIGGMVHISDLSWTKRYNHPSEVTKVGDKIEIVVLEIDEENRKLSLGHKQIEEDPWDAFEEVFPVGSMHEGSVQKKDDKGAIVLLPYGLEGFCPIKHLKKEDGTTPADEEVLNFVILEFDRNNKRILVSHSKFWGEQKNEEMKQKEVEVQKEQKVTKQKVQKMNKQTEKSTLGDLEALNELKEKMDTQSKEAAKSKLETAAKKKAKAADAEEKEADDDAEKTSDSEAEKKADSKAEKKEDKKEKDTDSDESK